MRLAIISDIHANHVAFEAVLRHVSKTGVDGLVFLGDYVTDFPGVRETMALLRQCQADYPCWFIRGNREEYLLDHRENPVPRWERSTAKGSLLYAYERLTPAELDWFASLPIAMTVRPEGAAAFEICHASRQGSRKSGFYDVTFARQMLEGMRTQLMIVGHNHLVRAQCLGKKKLCFVSSVGLPDGYGGCAMFAYLSDEDGFWQLRNQVIPYDVDAALREFETLGLNGYGFYWSKAVQACARTGYNVTLAFAERGAELARERGIDGLIPEDVWEQAARELGLAEP